MNQSNGQNQDNEQHGFMGMLSQAANSVVETVKNLTGNEEKSQHSQGPGNQENNYQNNHHKKNKHQH
ncbi:hypothetical protein [Peribacillus kribbensis]|uniref:hypothetical protein n=1 Tax=Peribacillus kribbensis TaxID=356658 RepID=UPI000425912E|nr:hypothetical protein [Peribacillus kribbensis]